MTENHVKRLSRSDWIDAAIAVMTDSSVEQLKIEKLAARLGASKGSFYWHFKDRNDLLGAVLAEWQSRTSTAVELRVDKTETSAKGRILRIMQLPLHSRTAAAAADLELAIMGWARRSAAAGVAVSAVDATRCAYIRRHFELLGLTSAEAEFRAHQAYSLIRYVAQRRDLDTAYRSQLIDQLHLSLTSDCADVVVE